MIVNPVLESALEYAEIGFKVLPVCGVRNGVCTCYGTNPQCKPGKHPDCRRGVHDATTDQDTIRQWFAPAPWRNLAIAPDDTFFVVDVDPKNGGDCQWTRTLTKLLNPNCYEPEALSVGRVLPRSPWSSPAISPEHVTSEPDGGSPTVAIVWVPRTRTLTTPRAAR